MKEFRKNEYGFFICEECGKCFYKKFGLSNHIYYKHKNISKKEYYDKWMREKNDGICKTCGKETQFLNLKGYEEYCSSKCVATNIILCERRKITCFKNHGYKGFNKKKEKQTKKEKYGDENYNNRKKFKNTMLKIYNVEHALQNKNICKKFIKTCNERYGVDYPAQNKKIYEKNKKTCKERYGTEYTFQSEQIKEKTKQTYLKHFGVDHNMRNKNQFEKQQKSGFKMKYFKDTNIYYRGTFELDFLEKYYNKYPNIQNGPTIKYKFERKNRVYFPDFIIPSLNLIIEIKYSYYAKRDKYKILAKKKATISNGFNYVMIIDKNYKKFEKLTNLECTR